MGQTNKADIGLIKEIVGKYGADEVCHVAGWHDRRSEIRAILIMISNGIVRPVDLGRELETKTGIVATKGRLWHYLNKITNKFRDRNFILDLREEASQRPWRKQKDDDTAEIHFDPRRDLHQVQKLGRKQIYIVVGQGRRKIEQIVKKNRRRSKYARAT